MSKPEFKWWDALLAVLGTLLVLGAWANGVAMNVLNILLVLYVPIGLATRISSGIKGKLETGFLRRPFAPEHRWFLIQGAVCWTFLVVWVLVLRASIVPVQLGDKLHAIWTFLALVLLASAGFQVFPKKRVLGWRNAFVATVTLFFGAQLALAGTSAFSSETIALDMPLRGDVVVFQGGASPLLNHHFILRAQRHALDLVSLKDGKMFEGDGAELASHACFGQSIHAPLAGTVVKVANERPDMPFGEMDREQIVGNHVVLQVAPERFVLMAHLKQGSVLVREGEQVACGAVLAQCGNSGNTSAPHLHLQVQDRADFGAPDLRTFPMVFRGATLVRGSQSRESNEPLRRNDLLRTDGEQCRP